MASIKNILLAVIIMVFGIAYVVSPLDLIPGLPIDDLVVAITTTAKSISEIKKGISQIPTIGSCIIALLVILIVSTIICRIY